MISSIDESVVLLAGGFGTRLRAMVKNVPKPLAPVGKSPFLQYLLQDLIDQGCRKFILSLHYQADQILRFIEQFKTEINSDIIMHAVIEPSPRGTGGALEFVVEQEFLKGTFYVMNADTYLPGGLRQLSQIAHNVDNAIALVPAPQTSRYGSVQVNSIDQVIGFHEKNAKVAARLINSGVYKLHTSFFTQKRQIKYSLERELFPDMIQKKQLYGYEIQTEFIDIGVPEDYQKFCLIANGF
jgi:D-glycero-alpha-D-manno-heptose 1-phosphate guanylyltransferase